MLDRTATIEVYATAADRLSHETSKPTASYEVGCRLLSAYSAINPSSNLLQGTVNAIEVQVRWNKDFSALPRARCRIALDGDPADYSFRGSQLMPGRRRWMILQAST